MSRSLTLATRLFDTKGQGKLLYEALKQYKGQPPERPQTGRICRSRTSFKKDVAATEGDFHQAIALDITVPKSQSGNADFR